MQMQSLNHAHLKKKSVFVVRIQIQAPVDWELLYFSYLINMETFNKLIYILVQASFIWSIAEC